MPSAHLRDQRVQRVAQFAVGLNEVVTAQDGEPSHVGQGGELVEVAALGLQLREQSVQSFYPGDFLSEPADDQIVGEGHICIPRQRLEFALDLRCHPGGDDSCFLFLH